MRARFTHSFALPIVLLLSALFFQNAHAQTGVLNPNDPIVIYNPANPPATPPANTLAKWVKTTRLGWNTTSLKCYYYNGIPFRIKFPKSYSTAADGKTYPLYLFFHGVGEKGTIYDNEYSMAHGGDVHSAAVDRGGLNGFDGFLVYPQSTSASGGWNAAQLSVVMNLIQNYMIPQVKVDPYRIIVNGLSGGGSATWMFVENYPKMTAAAIPMSSASSQDVTHMASLVFNQIWLTTGGLDVAPSPFTAQQVATEAANQGCDFYWHLYTTLAHNVWDSTWKEPNYFPFMNRAHMANPWVRYGRSQFCPGDPINVTIGVTPGFPNYEWRKNGVTIQGATSNSINVTDLGTYDCRIYNGTVWSVFSPIPAVISIKQATISPDIQVSGLASNVIPAPDGSTTVNLQVPTGYVGYAWQKLNPTTALSTTTNVLTGATVGQYQVKVTEQFGCTSSFSNTFTVIDANGPNPPSTPLNLQANVVGQTQIKLNWTEDPSAVNQETQFEIYQATASDGPYKLIGFSPADIDTFMVSGLNSKTRFYYKVRSINTTAGSAATAPSSALTPSDVTPPTAPNNLRTGSITANSVELIWDISTDNVAVTNYDIYVNGIYSYTTTADNNSFSVYNLTNGQIYTFAVKARDLSNNRSLPSNQVIAAAAFNGLNYQYYTFTGTWNALPNFNTLVPDATGTVPNVTIANRDQEDNFSFLWQGYIQIPVNGSYTFRTNSDDGSRLWLGAVGQTSSPYSFTATPLVNNDGLHGGQNKDGAITLTAGVYPIAIGYYEQGGGQSITVSWKTPQTGTNFVTIPDSVFRQKITYPVTPIPPTKLTATAATAKKINLTWQDNSSDETGFEIYRSVSPTDGFGIVGTTKANITSFGDSSCSALTKYYYKVRAISKNGSSKFNGQDSMGLTYSYYNPYTTATLAAINTLTPVSTGFVNNFTLSVATATTNYALKFDGYINIKTAGSYTFYTNSDDGSSLYIDGTLLVNNDGGHGATEKSASRTLTVGRHAIRVLYFQGTGGASLITSYAGPGISKSAIPDSVLAFTPANATTFALPALPTAPTGLNGTPLGPNKINLTWTNPGPAIVNRFEIWRSPGNNANYDLARNADGALTTFIDSGLTANTIYFYKLRSVNEAGISDYSNEINLSTNSNPASTVVLSTIPTQKFYNDSTVVIPLTATTDLGSTITYTASGLPAFGKLVSNPDNTGTITLLAGALDLGRYTVTVTATDNFQNSNSKTFVINVFGRNQQTINVNFDYGFAQATASWNNTNVNTPATAGLTLNNLRDSTGASTATSLTLVNAWSFASSNGPTTGNNSGIFPDNVMKTCYVNSSGTPTVLVIKNLVPTRKYSVLFFAAYPWTPAQQAASGTAVGSYSIGSQTVILDAANNTSQTVQINSISPDASGNITVSIVRAPGSGYAILNAMQILAYDVKDTLNKPYGLSAVGTSSSAIKLAWQAPADIRTGFEIWRSQTANGTYSLLNSVAANANSYIDNSLPANATFFYKVRSVNNTKYSDFSDSAGGSTVAYVVNLQFNSASTDAVGQPDWNSTNFRVYEGFVQSNLTNTLGQGTGIDFTGGAPFNNVSTTLGVTTGNNSGPVPDKVMKTAYYIGFTLTATFTFNNLNQTNLYNLVFYGGDTYNNTGTTVYKIGNQATTLNTLNNISQTATLFGIRPDSSGSITVSVYSTQGYGWINSVTLQAMLNPVFANGGTGDGTGILATPSTLLHTQVTEDANSTVDQVLVYPNPFTDDVTLKLGLKQDVARFMVIVSDMNGRTVQRKQFENASAGIWQQRLGLNGSMWNPGVYVIQVVGIPGEKPRVFKLIKVR